MLKTFAEIMLRVALDLGAAKYPAGSNNTPILPTDPATLSKIRDAVNRGRSEFYADFPDAQFRRRVLEIDIGAGATTYQVDGDSSTYKLPVDWMGPPQGKIVITGGRGGFLVLTSMDRVRAAEATYAAASAIPTMIACELEPEPQQGEVSRWLMRVWPPPDISYTVALRGRWRAVEINDIQDAEPTGHGDAIVAYAVSYAVSKGLIQTGVTPASAMQTKLEWKARVMAEEGVSGPRTLGKTRPARRQKSTYPLPLIRATNPYAQ